MVNSRNLDKWKYPNISHNSIDEFLSIKSLQSGLHSIKFDECYIDFLILIKDDAPILYSFNGAISSRDTMQLPMFSGLGVCGNLHLTTCMFNDPSLYRDDSLCLSWYAGDDNLNTQQEINSIIKKINSLLKPSRNIFFGGSGGGYASLYFSNFVDNSIALVWNPQTIIENYNPNFVKAFYKSCYPNGNDSFTKDLTALTPSQQRKIIYLQNSSDWHVDSHLLPFLRFISPQNFSKKLTNQASHLNSSTYLHLDTWGVGHAPPPREYLRALVELTTHQDFDFNDSTKLKECINYIYEHEAKLELQGDTLEVTSSASSLAEIQYAFYLHKDNERVEVIWYQDSATVQFQTKVSQGSWHVTSFVKIASKTPYTTSNTITI